MLTIHLSIHSLIHQVPSSSTPAAFTRSAPGCSWPLVSGEGCSVVEYSLVLKLRMWLCGCMAVCICVCVYVSVCPWKPDNFCIFCIYLGIFGYKLCCWSSHRNNQRSDEEIKSSMCCFADCLLSAREWSDVINKPYTYFWIPLIEEKPKSRRKQEPKAAGHVSFWNCNLKITVPLYLKKYALI